MHGATHHSQWSEAFAASWLGMVAMTSAGISTALTRASGSRGRATVEISSNLSTSRTIPCTATGYVAPGVWVQPSALPHMLHYRRPAALRRRSKWRRVRDRTSSNPDYTGSRAAGRRTRETCRPGGESATGGRRQTSDRSPAAPGTQIARRPFPRSCGPTRAPRWRELCPQGGRRH